MNGTMELSSEVIAVSEKASENWPKEDLLGLLESMRINLPQNDLTKFKTAESHLDWGKVAFNQYTADMCKQKWFEISHEVRKFRTLSEIILDAQDHVKNPYKGKKLKKHPDFPKKPLTPYFRFFMEKRAKYAKLHPEMSNLDLTKILSMKYKELPDKKKVRKFRTLSEIILDAQDHVKNPYKGKKLKKHPDFPKKPLTPYFRFFMEKRAKYAKLHPEMSNLDLTKILSMKYKELPDKKKTVKHDPGAVAKGQHEPGQHFTLFALKNGYQKFSQELLSNGELNQLPLKERMVEIGGRWQKLSQAHKDRYKKMAEEKQKQYKVQLEQWLKSLSSQDRAMYKEYTSNKRKSTAKPRGTIAKVKAVVARKSDTEEDDDEEEEEEKADSSEEDSSSDEESEEGEENEEEEEEEGDEEAEDKENESESSSSSSSSEETSDSDSD
ncbi:UNVERIFIED_CONTAM: hypothetical protein FKN15_036320 [Acipenser sinensis]